MIVAGDFNEQRQVIQKKLIARGFKAAIPEGHPTHSAGNQLDQVFANFGVDVEQLPAGTVNSDHTSFVITTTIT